MQISDETTYVECPNCNGSITPTTRLLNHALAYEYMEVNPTRSIRPNPDSRLTRFLSCQEFHKLHHVPDGCSYGFSSQIQQTDIIRRLPLTGYREGEIVWLHREKVKGDRLELRDSKTSPKRS